MSMPWPNLVEGTKPARPTCGYRGYVLAQPFKESVELWGLPPFDTRESRNRTDSYVRPGQRTRSQSSATFSLNDTDDEWHRVKGLLAAAERALREITSSAIRCLCWS